MTAAFSFVAFTATVAAISWWVTRKDRMDSSEAYFLAGRSLRSRFLGPLEAFLDPLLALVEHPEDRSPQEQAEHDEQDQEVDELGDEARQVQPEGGDALDYCNRPRIRRPETLWG